ncbi:MAG: hypothetical protein KAX40_09250 [Herpetosiphon sp.]|nr:hypothetical protein [Herpetosiphon sp.]
MNPNPKPYKIPRCLWGMIALVCLLISVSIIVACQDQTASTTALPPAQPTGAPIATFVQANVEPTVMGTPLPEPNRELVLFVNDYFNDVQVFAAQPFDQQTVADDWQFFPSTQYSVSNGTLRLLPLPPSEQLSGMIQPNPLGQRQGFAVQFRYSGTSSDSLCQIGLSERPDQETTQHFLYMLTCDQTDSHGYRVQGESQQLSQQPATFNLESETWYNLTMAILPSGEFVAVVRPTDDLKKQAMIARGAFDRDWSGYIFMKNMPEATLELRNPMLFRFADMK